MQPNQQDPYSSQSAQQPAQNVPDFLQLNTPQSAPKNNKAKPVIFVAVVLLLLGGAGAVILTWMQDAPERRFYDALSNAMQTSYITRKYETTTAGSTISATVETDCTVVTQCKGKVTYSYTGTDQAKPTSRQVKTVINGEEIVPNNNEFFSRIDAVSPQPTSLTSLNQWYKVNSEDSAGMHSRFTVNSYRGFVLMGNFNSSQQSQLMDFIKTKNIYSITKIEEENLNGAATTVYTIKTDHQKVTDLNNNAWALIKDKAASVKNSNGFLPLEFKLWVNNATNKFVQQSVQDQTDQGSERREKVIFSYPSQVSIQAPSDAKDLPQS